MMTVVVCPEVKVNMPFNGTNAVKGMQKHSGKEKRYKIQFAFYAQAHWVCTTQIPMIRRHTFIKFIKKIQNQQTIVPKNTKIFYKIMNKLHHYFLNTVIKCIEFDNYT